MFIRNTPNLIKKNKNNFYKCTDLDLKLFLEKQNIVSIYKEKDKNLWIFILSKDLQNALNIWNDK